MDIEIVTQPDIDVCGLQTEITRSQQENYRIIRTHWRNFNTHLRARDLKRTKNWEKFGIITHINDKYSYLSAIKKTAEIPGFKSYTIAGGEFAKFCHQGNLESIRFTILDIYKNKIPRANYKIDLDRALIHFEHYDHRFHWDRKDSIIEIYVPLIF